MGRSTEKYEYRKNKIPYRYEVTVARELGMSLKIYEFFDGENVKWCMGMDAETMTNYKTFNCTPLFDNIAIDENNDNYEYWKTISNKYGFKMVEYNMNYSY